jgi:nitrile hydratase beta subunit
MNAAHDMGGMQSFGAVVIEPNEPWFHDEWERRAFAVTLAMGATGAWNLDMARAARESLPPAQYLSNTYYQIWFDALVKLLVEKGLVTEKEIREGKAKAPAAPNVRKLLKENVAAVLAKGGPSEREVSVSARFKTGDAVRTKLMNPATHTRLPRYCRDKPGTVVGVRGAHVFPDKNALGLGDQPQWLYTVEFDAKKLWGPDTTASSVCVDCWESYLEQV